LRRRESCLQPCLPRRKLRDVQSQLGARRILERIGGHIHQTRKCSAKVGAAAGSEQLQSCSQVEVRKPRLSPPYLRALKRQLEVVKACLTTKQLTRDVEGAFVLVPFPARLIEVRWDWLSAPGSAQGFLSFRLRLQSYAKRGDWQRVVAKLK